MSNKTIKNGKYTCVIEIQEIKDFILSFCKDEGIQITEEESLNYIFKAQSKADNNFSNYKLKDNNVSSDYNETQSSVVLKIPTVLEGNEPNERAAPGVYYIRIYPESALDTNDSLTTISFISYYAYATYKYTINKSETNIESFSYTINNFPEDQTYIVSIIAVIKNGENEEIFAYNQIILTKKQTKEEEVKKNKTPIIVLSICISIGVILLGIAIYFFVRMFKKNKQLDDELSKIISVQTKEDEPESKEKYLL